MEIDRERVRIYMAKGDFNYINLNVELCECSGEDFSFPPLNIEYETVKLEYLGEDRDTFFTESSDCGRYIYTDLNGNIYSIAIALIEDRVIMKEFKTKIVLKQKFHEK